MEDGVSDGLREGDTESEGKGDAVPETEGVGLMLCVGETDLFIEVEDEGEFEGEPERDEDFEGDLELVFDPVLEVVNEGETETGIWVLLAERDSVSELE